MEDIKKKIQQLKDELVLIENQLYDIEKKSEITIMNASQTSTAKLQWNGGINTTFNFPRLDIVTSGTIVVAENVQSGFLRGNTLVKTTINNEPIFLLASKAHTP